MKKTFHNCFNLLHVKLPQNLLSIGISAFDGCKKFNCNKIAFKLKNY